jgi:hypothetical protein
MITVVSGLPRSGTSLMMQVLAAGGVPPLTDHARRADTSNPRGYYEWEPVKRMARETVPIGEAEGKAVKVVSPLVMSLPPQHLYAVVFMLRPLSDVIASQAEMIRRLGTTGAPLAPEQLATAFCLQLAQVLRWLASQPHIQTLRVNYQDLIHEPAKYAREVQTFLARPLDIGRMAAQVDASLCHQRPGS